MRRNLGTGFMRKFFHLFMLMTFCILLSTFSLAHAQSFSPNEITSYRPAPKGGTNAQAGLSDSIEGGELDAHDKVIWGNNTFEDYHNGKGGSDPYVAVAMDKNSNMQGKYLTSEQYPGTVFKVVDNGGHGNGQTGNNWMDIAWRDPNMSTGENPNGTNRNGKNGFATFNVVSKEEAAAVAAQRSPNGYSGDSGDYVKGGTKGIQPGDTSGGTYANNQGSNTQNPSAGPGGNQSGNNANAGNNANGAGNPFGNFANNAGGQAFSGGAGAAEQPDARRIYKKGVEPAEVEETKDQFTKVNDENMKELCCNNSKENSVHKKKDLEKAFEWEFQSCDILVKYKGSGRIAGKLYKVIGYCMQEERPQFLIADEIEYRFPVETRDSSVQMGDSPLRINYKYAGTKTAQKPAPIDSGGGGFSGGNGGAGGSGGTGGGFTGDGGSPDVINNGCGSFSFNSNADIDTDGRGQRIPGQTELPETSFRWGNGQSLNSDTTNFIVLPINSQEFGNCRDHLGKYASVTYGGVTKHGIVGDCGPNGKTGEMSSAMAQDFNDDPNLKARKPDQNGNGKVDHYEGFGEGNQVKYTIYNSKVDKNRQMDNGQIVQGGQQAQQIQDNCNETGSPGTGNNALVNQQGTNAQAF